MFSIVIEDPKWFRTAFETISSIVNEVEINVSRSDGLIITSMDLSHICLVHFNATNKDCTFSFNPEYFTETEPEPNLSFGISTEDLLKVLKRCDISKERIELSITENSKKELQIHFINKKTEKDRKFKLLMIDLEGEEIDMANLLGMEYKNIFKMRTNILEDAIKDAEIFSELLHLSVIPEKEALNYLSSGNMGEVDVDIKKTDPAFIEPPNFKDACSSSFAISFLRNILKTAAICDNAEIYLSQDGPIRIDFEFKQKGLASMMKKKDDVSEETSVDDNISNNSKLIFFLAPRVEDDSDPVYED